MLIDETPPTVVWAVGVLNSGPYGDSNPGPVVENRVPLVCDAKRRTSGCERRRNRGVWFVLFAIWEIDVCERAIVSGPTR
jgi:hypothetical protein